MLKATKPEQTPVTKEDMLLHLLQLIIPPFKTACEIITTTLQDITWQQLETAKTEISQYAIFLEQLSGEAKKGKKNINVTLEKLREFQTRLNKYQTHGGAPTFVDYTSLTTLPPLVKNLNSFHTAANNAISKLVFLYDAYAKQENDITFTEDKTSKDRSACYWDMGLNTCFTLLVMYCQYFIPIKTKLKWVLTAPLLLLTGLDIRMKYNKLQEASNTLQKCTDEKQEMQAQLKMYHDYCGTLPSAAFDIAWGSYDKYQKAVNPKLSNFSCFNHYTKQMQERFATSNSSAMMQNILVPPVIKPQRPSIQT